MMCDTPLYPQIASVEPHLEMTHFKKCIYMQDVLCNVIEHIMHLKCWLCGPDIGPLHVYAYMLYV